MQDILDEIKSFFENFIDELKEGDPLHIAITAAAALLLAVIIVIIIMSAVQGGADSNTAPVANSIATSAPEDELYDKDANKIEKSEFDGTILTETPDAGEEYIDETLFVGDSNTARMPMFGPVTLQNSLGASSMGIQHVTSDACMYFSGYSSPITVVQAVKLMQPRRIYINYGTNNTAWNTDTFIQYYKNALDQIHNAYEYADIVIVGVLPVARIRTYTSITMQTIDSFNAALVQLAHDEGYYYLDSSEAVADSTGYATASYMETDGIHLNSTGMAVYMEYVRTHALDTEDRRPALTAIPTHSMATPDSHFGPAIVSSSEESSSSSSSHVHAYTVTMITAPTCVSEGLQRYTCEEDGDEYDEVIPPTGVHTFGEWIVDVPAGVGTVGSQHRVCSVCGYNEVAEIPALTCTHDAGAWDSDTSVPGVHNRYCTICGALLETITTPEPTPTPEPAPEPTPTPDTPASAAETPTA